MTTHRSRLAAGVVAGLALVSATAGAAAPPAPWSLIGLDSVLARQALAEGESLRVTPLGGGRHSTAVLIQLAPGAQVAGHVHREHDETIFLFSGELRLRAGEEVRALRPGEWAGIPEGTPHGARAGPAGAVAISIYAPVWDPRDRHRDARGDP